MGNYSENKKTYNQQYTKENYKPLSVLVPKQYYTDVLAPAIEKEGVSRNAFVRKALDFYIESHS